MKRFALLTALVAAPLTVSSDAFAQNYEDLDGDGKEKKKKEKGPKEVKEIVRGFYAKSNVGGAIYLLNFSGFVNAGSSVGLELGQDFVETNNSSMAWGLGFFQGVHNGAHFENQAEVGCQIAGGAAPCVQGDLRTYTALATIEYSFYLTRRLGIGLRAGGGVLLSPLLMHEEFYQSEVLTSWGLTDDPGYHSGIHPVGAGGPTFEYYTKLSHFSIGADVDVFYAVNFDLGTNITGYLKYTF